MLLHHHLLTMKRDHPERKNFLLTFLQNRGVLHIYNRMKYEEDGIEVIDARSILKHEKRLRENLGLESKSPSVPSDLFVFLRDLTKQYPLSNISIDEVDFKMFLDQTESIHHPDFKGSLWLAISSVKQ